MTSEKSYEAIINSFCRWYNGEVFSEEQKQWLSNNTNIDEYNDIREFYREMGFQDEDGALTEIGKESLKAWKQDAGSKTAPTVGTQTRPGDDRREEWETERMTPEEWEANNYYAVEICEVDAIPLDDRTKRHWRLVIGYDDYISARDDIHNKNWYIGGESFQTEAQYFPGLLTYEDAVNEFKTADERHLELKHFPQFSKTAKIKIHDSAVIAADTGAGKSSLAINFLNDLNDDYPVLYFNLEMDGLTILRRLVAIRTGIELDRIEGYQKDEHTEAAVNSALRAITSRKPLQILKDVYNLEDMEAIIAKATKDRKDPTIVIVDHSLLVQTKDKKVNGRYERFTHISEELRRISRRYNIVLFILLQQSREGKKDDTEPPKNSSLKESGSWENDATQIIFLWYDPNIKRKKLIITKNRNGDGGSFLLNYTKQTQTYTEAKEQPQGGGASFDLHNLTLDPTGGQTKRDKMRDKLRVAYEDVVAKTGEGNVTLKDLAEVLDVKTATVKGYLKEYGGFTLDGEAVDPAGIDNIVENSGFIIRLTPGEAAEIPFDDPDDVIG